MNPISFGASYRYYQKPEAEAKQRELNQQGIDSAIEYKSSQGILQVISWLVHTNENTPDLDNFRRRGGQ